MSVVDRPTVPEVSIVMPVFDDEVWVETALRSCTAQTLRNIEIVVVDDASNDNTIDVVERYAKLDPRVRLVRHDTNRTAFEARRTGIQWARAPRILFLDGDDELVPEAAEVALQIARDAGADVVGFGCVVIASDGSTGGRYEREMQPKYPRLKGDEIVESLFPAGEPAQGQLWRYLFDRSLLEDAYDQLPLDIVAPRVNDLPLAFLALSIARLYVSTPKRLYRYFFRRGASGHQIASMEDYLFNASAIDSIDLIAGAVSLRVAARPDGDILERLYRSVRLSVIGRVLHYVVLADDHRIRATSLDLLAERVGWGDVIAASGDFCPEALPLLTRSSSLEPVIPDGAKRIMLRTGNLRTGGVQGVLVAQAKYLLDAGFHVAIAIDSDGPRDFSIPAGIGVYVISGRSLAEKLSSFARLCSSLEIDSIIDHHVFYNDVWPYFVLTANSLGVQTIAWIHNFALRPLLDGTERIPFLRDYLPSLSYVVVLSLADVAFWTSQGVERVVFIPNPPSPLLEAVKVPMPRKLEHSRVEIAWWGRLQRATKQVDELIRIAGALQQKGIDFRLTIVGPDSPDLSARDLRRIAEEEGVGDRVRTLGALHGPALMAEIATADVFLSTSIIEGYPLVLIEAQAFGLPVVMYDLPWLAVLESNDAIVTVPQGDRVAAADALIELVTHEGEYERRSMAAASTARTLQGLDFGAFYSDLVAGRLRTQLSDELRASLLALLLDQSLFFANTLIAREKRAVHRARSRVRALERGAAGRSTDEQRVPPSRGQLRRAQLAPSKKASGVKGWLQSFLPATMRQASYYARHNHSAGWAQYGAVVSEFDSLAQRLDQIESSLSILRRHPHAATASQSTDSAQGVVVSRSSTPTDLAGGVTVRDATDAESSVSGDPRLSPIDERLTENSSGRPTGEVSQ